MSWAKNVKDKKVNNHRASKSDKVALRRQVLEVLPGARVLDAFAGAGSMYRQVWRDAAGIDGNQNGWRFISH